MFQILKRHWISHVNPDTINFSLHVGKSFRVDDGTRRGREIVIEAKHIVGSKRKPINIEIWDTNGLQYSLPAIDFYAQLDGKRASREEIEFFETMAFEVKVTRNWRPSWARGAGKKKLWTPGS